MTPQDQIDALREMLARLVRDMETLSRSHDALALRVLFLEEVWGVERDVDGKEGHAGNADVA